MPRRSRPASQTYSGRSSRPFDSIMWHGIGIELAASGSQLISCNYYLYDSLPRKLANQRLAPICSASKSARALFSPSTHYGRPILTALAQTSRSRLALLMQLWAVKKLRSCLWMSNEFFGFMVNKCLCKITRYHDGAAVDG